MVGGGPGPGEVVASRVLRPWDEGRCGPISMGAIRARHAPEHRCEIELATYPPGVGFPAASRACLL